ncbi:MAG: transporter substrate-binding domain-containing protein [Bacteroidales bacterium]|nr:transporter substrate-binding domain-containing protein [Bacteroidales bacterium]
MIKKFFILFLLLGTVLTSCSYLNPGSETNTARYNSFDLDSIRSRGKLIAVTDFNSTNYFIYKGEPMGFNYELLKSFSDNIGIDLEIISENQLDKAFELLNTGKADLVATGLTVNSSRKKDILFTEPIDETRQVLVQRKPRNWRSLTADAVDKKLIRNQLGLARKTIYVQAGSSHVERLETLASELGDSINIIEVPFDSEKLIRNVAEGLIDYTVCDENIAMVNATYYRDIDIATPVSFPQNLAWGVRKENSEKLLHELNHWITSYKKTGSYALLYAKYFRNSRSSMIVRSDYYALSTGKVSRYDDMIKKYSGRIDWDWRLLASLICQESRFDPDVESGAGAIGLMQIMPLTGENFGIDITASPESNMKAGIEYINWLHSIFDSKIPNEKERINFILAAYNAGPGHVLDAMKLAEKHGMDPHKWDGNVAVWLLKKSEPKYFNDEVVKNGYFRGTESVAFVSQVINRYEHYKNIIPEEKLK